MLILTRKPGESIVIGNNVTVTIVEVRGDQVRVGVDAPRSVQVHRDEVFRELARENVDAVAAAQRARGVVSRARRVDRGAAPTSSPDPSAHDPAPPDSSPPPPRPDESGA